MLNSSCFSLQLFLTQCSYYIVHSHCYDDQEVQDEVTHLTLASKKSEITKQIITTCAFKEGSRSRSIDTVKNSQKVKLAVSKNKNHHLLLLTVAKNEQIYNSALLRLTTLHSKTTFGNYVLSDSSPEGSAKIQSASFSVFCETEPPFLVMLRFLKYTKAKSFIR